MSIVIYLLYAQLNNVKLVDWQNVAIHSYFNLIIVILLVYPNIWFEYKKWKTTIDFAELPNDNKRIRNSFFAGLITGLLTPNMVGNFVGRLYYFHKDSRLAITSLTLVSNYAQFIVTLTLGTISVIVTGQFFGLGKNEYIIGLLLLATLSGFLFYFKLEYLLSRFFKKEQGKILMDLLKTKNSFRLELVFYSTLRFAVFSFQFILLLNVFGESFSWLSYMAIWQVYLLTMVAPSILLGKIGVKEAVSIFVLTSIGMTSLNVLIASLILWFLNTLLPVLIALFYVKRKAYD